MKLAPLWISFLLLICLFACAKVQDDSGRTLRNANSVISPAGQKLWNGSSSSSVDATTPSK
ncbi:MAG: hypothetical protein U0136_04265 [Bdellovibrionota bacterium]